MEKQKAKNNEKRDKYIISGLLLLLLLMAMFVIWLFFGMKGADGAPHPDDTDKIDFSVDNNATDDDIKGKSNAELVAELNQKVKEGMNTITMNSNPIFADGKAKGTLGIYCDTKNYYPQFYEIYTKDTDQLIYKGGVEIGQRINTSNLLIDLPKGTYDCYLRVSLVDSNTGDRIGTSDTPPCIKITILA